MCIPSNTAKFGHVQLFHNSCIRVNFNPAWRWCLPVLLQNSKLQLYPLLLNVLLQSCNIAIASFFIPWTDLFSLSKTHLFLLYHKLQQTNPTSLHLSKVKYSKARYKTFSTVSPLPTCTSSFKPKHNLIDRAKLQSKRR